MKFTSFNGADRLAARAFSQAWLPAWTGNDPERLTAFYAEDALYIDDAIPDGVRGRQALLAYFTRLLRHNPSWVWTQREAIPMEGGFINRFHADIPVGDRIIGAEGVCLVWMNSNGRIARNEVFFDRSELIAAITAHRAAKRP